MTSVESFVMMGVLIGGGPRGWEGGCLNCYLGVYPISHIKHCHRLLEQSALALLMDDGRGRGGGKGGGRGG